VDTLRRPKDVCLFFNAIYELSSVTLGPELCHPVMFLPVLSVLGCYGSHQGVRGVAVSKQGTDTQQDLRYSESRTPVVFQNVETNDALGVDVAMVDPGPEDNFWWFEWVVRGKMYVQEKYPALVHRGRWTQDRGDPLVQIVPFRTRAAIWRRIQRDLS